MIMSIRTEKASEKIQPPFTTQDSTESEHRRNMPQYNKGFI